MFDWLLPRNHAITILKNDHASVEDLFEAFEQAETPASRKNIINQAVTELKIHATIEEEIFYPAIRKHVGDRLMNEADEEHHVAKVLIAELDESGDRNNHRDAKFTVLAESVRHHIKEEEEQVLPKAKGMDIDFEVLGQRMLDRKKQLMKDGVPTDAEHTMVARSGATRGKTTRARTPSHNVR